MGRQSESDSFHWLAPTDWSTPPSTSGHWDGSAVAGSILKLGRAGPMGILWEGPVAEKRISEAGSLPLVETQIQRYADDECRGTRADVPQTPTRELA